MNGIRRESLSEEFYQEALKQETSKAFIHLLDVHIVEEGDSVPTVYYFCDDYSPLTFNDGVGSGDIIYQPASFNINLGQDSGDSTPEITLTFDSGDRDMIRRLRRTNRTPKFYLSVVMAPYGDTDAVISHREVSPIELEASDFNFQSTSARMKLIVEPFLEEPIGTAKMSPRLASGLWSNTSV